MPSGWLIDVYDTLLTVDFDAVSAGLSRVAGVPADAFTSAVAPLRTRTTTGALSWSAAFEHVLGVCGRPSTPALVTELVNADQVLLKVHARVFDDAIDLLQRLKLAGASAVVISNCAQHTRELLEHLHLDQLFDDLVLSCEVGAIKPDPAIYRTALARLDMDPGDTVLVDDQPSYCAGAVALGMSAVQIARSGSTSVDAGHAGRRWAVCRRLTEVGPGTGSPR